MLQNPNDRCLVNGSSIALACKQISKKQTHVGLLCRLMNNVPILLHFEQNKKLTTEVWDQQYHWIEFSDQFIDPENQEVFVDWAVYQVAHLNKSNISYGLKFTASSTFDILGEYRPNENDTGLTCATFVLSLFASFGISLADLSSWPEADEQDLSWARKVFQWFRKNGIFFFERHWLMKASEWKRYKPEEVFATAFLYKGEELLFNEIKPVSIDLLEKIRR